MTGAGPGGAGAARGGAYVCPRCGAGRVHRSRTRSLLEALIRAVTPYRAVRCRSCGHRGWILRGRRRAGTGSARPLERRDVEAARRQRVRLVVMALFAAVIGAAVALWFIVE